MTRYALIAASCIAAIFISVSQAHAAADNNTTSFRRVDPLTRYQYNRRSLNRQVEQGLIRAESSFEYKQRLREAREAFIQREVRKPRTYNYTTGEYNKRLPRSIQRPSRPAVRQSVYRASELQQVNRSSLQVPDECANLSRQRRTRCLIELQTGGTYQLRQTTR